MKIEIELKGELQCWIIRVCGKEFRSKHSTDEDLKKLWLSVLKANIIENTDEERDIYNEDEEYPCSIRDIVWTEHNLRQDGYYFDY